MLFEGADSRMIGTELNLIFKQFIEIKYVSNGKKRKPLVEKLFQFAFSISMEMQILD